MRSCLHHNDIEIEVMFAMNTYRAGWMDGTLFDVVYKAYVVSWMPIEGIKHRIKFHGVD